MKSETYYRVPRNELLDLVTISPSAVILDVGCGSGANAAYLRQHGAERLVGIEIEPDVAARAARDYDEVYVGHATDIARDLDIKPDVIVAADVLEHLAEPAQLLQEFRRLLAPGGRLLVSLPNVRHISVLRMLALKGEWQYADSGIMDSTHLRWFTKASAHSMLQECGFQICVEAPKYNTARQVRWASIAPTALRDFLAEQWLFACA